MPKLRALNKNQRDSKQIPISFTNFKPMGRSENKSLTQIPPFEDKVRAEVTNTSQDLSFTEVIVLVLIKQGYEIWLPYPRMRDPVAANGENLRQSSSL